MALARHGSRLIFFAHVPKTGGTSIEHYLQERCEDVVQVDTHKCRGRTGTGLLISSTHLSAMDLQEFIFKRLDLSFTVVRDPVSRLFSEYRYQYGISRTTRFSFQTWLRIMAACARLDCRAYDNHIRPQSDLVPDGCEIFRLEDGLDRVADRIDQVLGCSWEGGGIPHRNIRPPRDVRLFRQDCELIARMYEADYARFGYSPPDPRTHSSDRIAASRSLFATTIAPIIVMRQRSRWIR